MKKLLILLLMIPTLSFAKYDSKYDNWIEGECIKMTYSAKNDFTAKKVYKRCEKGHKKCISEAIKNGTSSVYSYKRCMKKETGWTEVPTPKDLR